MTRKPTIENLEYWFEANAGKRRSYAQKSALEFCGLLISAMREIEFLTQSNVASAEQTMAVSSASVTDTNKHPGGE